MRFCIDNKEYLTQEEVEALIGIKQTTLNTLVRFGHFPAPLKLEIRKLWKRSEVEAYIESLESTKQK